jgi:hypothetical protein
MSLFPYIGACLLVVVVLLFIILGWRLRAWWAGLAILFLCPFPVTKFSWECFASDMDWHKVDHCTHQNYICFYKKIHDQVKALPYCFCLSSRTFPGRGESKCPWLPACCPGLLLQLPLDPSL